MRRPIKSQSINQSFNTLCLQGFRAACAELVLRYARLHARRGLALLLHHWQRQRRTRTRRQRHQPRRGQHQQHHAPLEWLQRRHQQTQQQQPSGGVDACGEEKHDDNHNDDPVPAMAGGEKGTFSKEEPQATTPSSATATAAAGSLPACGQSHLPHIANLCADVVRKIIRMASPGPPSLVNRPARVGTTLTGITPLIQVHVGACVRARTYYVS